jgi:ADP-heptose:LPS heptosyltransferase
VKILAIRLARLGDVILLLPALSSLKQALPGSHLTFLTGHRCAPIAEMCPAIDKVISVDRVAMRDGPAWKAIRGMSGLVRDIRREHFDLVVDFHGFRETNLLTWLSGAPVRTGLKRYREPHLGFCFNKPPVPEDKSLHVAEMFQRVVQGVVAPSRLSHFVGNAIAIPEDLKQWAAGAASAGPRLALYVDAPVPERIWPAEGFAAVADFAIANFAAKVIVISGKSGKDQAEKLLTASRNPSQMKLFRDITIPQMTALISSARLLVSNDTGPMHIGPAAGVQTLGLFSVGYPEHFRPNGPGGRFLRANPIERIEVSEVIDAVREMWPIAIAADRDPRY